MTFKSGVINENNALPVDDQGAPNIASGNVSISNEAVLIVPERIGRKAVLIKNCGDNYVLSVGNDTVTDLNGYRISPFTVEKIESSAAIYGTFGGSGSTSVNISFMELF